MTFSHLAYTGAFWTTLLRGSIRILTVLRIAVLARILSPAQFGSYGIATMALNLLEIATETGINSILLQEKSGIEKYVNTAWVISIIRGFVISGFLVLCAPIIANFFGSPDSLSLIYLSAWIPTIRGFINPSIIRYQKELNFNKEFYLRFGLIFIESVTIILWALSTLSASSLLWGMIVSALAEVIFSFLFIFPRPTFHIESTLFKSILNRGKWITGFGVLEYVYTNADNIFIGRMLGQTALGIYQNAYKLSLLPLTELVTVYYKVTFPVFTHMTEYPSRLKSASVKSALLLIGLLTVSSLAMFILAKPLVLLLLGSAWVEAVPIVRVLAFLALLRGVNFSFNSLMMAMKKQEYITLITLVSVVSLLIPLIPLINTYGSIGAGYAAIFSSIATLPVAYFFVNRTIRQVAK